MFGISVMTETVITIEFFNMSPIFMHENNRNLRNTQICMFYNWQVLKQIHKLFCVSVVLSS